MTDPKALRQEILRLPREYSRQVHASFRPAADPDRIPWQPGTTIPYAGRVFTEEEVEAAVGSTLDSGSPWAKKARRFRRSWRPSWAYATRCW